MPCKKLPINPRNRLLYVGLTVSSNKESKKQAELRMGDENLLSDKFFKCTALIDTGANISCITDHVAEKLGLLRRTTRSTKEIATPMGDFPAIEYVIHIWRFPCFPESITLVRNHKVLTIMKNQSHDLLIGMDIISKGSLFIGNGEFEFCMPVE